MKAAVGILLVFHIFWAVKVASHCTDPLGMEDNTILDSAINASSFSDVTGPERARLHMKGECINSRWYRAGWRATTDDQMQWLQIDLNKRTHVTGIATQRGYNGRVTGYSLSFRLDDAEQFNEYQNGKILTANGNWDKVARNNLEPPLIAKTLRINPKTWCRHITMRVELYGCTDISSSNGFHRTPSSANKSTRTTSPKVLTPTIKNTPVVSGPSLAINASISQAAVSSWYSTGKISRTAITKATWNKSSVQASPNIFRFWAVKAASNCTDPLGMEDNTILDSAINASSSYSNYTGPERARLHMKGERINNSWYRAGWRARTNDKMQWLQIDLKKITHVTGIATQGGYKYDYGRVTGYSLSFRLDDAKEFHEYENGKILTANGNRGTAVRNNLEPPLTAKTLRINPKTWCSIIGMRVELYGCTEISSSHGPGSISRADLTSEETTRLTQLSSFLKSSIRKTQDSSGPPFVFQVSVSQSSSSLHADNDATTIQAQITSNYLKGNSHAYTSSGKPAVAKVSTMNTQRTALPTTTTKKPMTLFSVTPNISSSNGFDRTPSSANKSTRTTSPIVLTPTIKHTPVVFGSSLVINASNCQAVSSGTSQEKSPVQQ